MHQQRVTRRQLGEQVLPATRQRSNRLPVEATRETGGERSSKVESVEDHPVEPLAGHRRFQTSSYAFDFRELRQRQASSRDKARVHSAGQDFGAGCKLRALLYAAVGQQGEHPPQAVLHVSHSTCQQISAHPTGSIHRSRTTVAEAIIQEEIAPGKIGSPAAGMLDRHDMFVGACHPSQNN
jgi:hypothetical protein